MAIDDPKTRMRPQEPKDDPAPDMTNVLAQMAAMQAETARLLLEMKQGSGGGNADVIAKLLEQQSQLLVKTKPENTDHPGISVFSYPEGDLKRPKPVLKCKFFWCGHEESADQLTPEEIDLRNQLEPGEYKVTKANGVEIKFTVTPKYTDAGRLEEMAVSYPCKKGEQRTDHMSNVAYLRQVLGERVPSLEELMAENARLRAVAAGLATSGVA
jgi:hypothetical protein